MIFSFVTFALEPWWSLFKSKLVSYFTSLCFSSTFFLPAVAACAIGSVIDGQLSLSSFSLCISSFVGFPVTFTGCTGLLFLFVLPALRSPSLVVLGFGSYLSFHLI